MGCPRLKQELVQGQGTGEKKQTANPSPWRYNNTKSLMPQTPVVEPHCVTSAPFLCICMILPFRPYVVGEGGLAEGAEESASEKVWEEFGYWGQLVLMVRDARSQ